MKRKIDPLAEAHLTPIITGVSDPAHARRFAGSSLSNIPNSAERHEACRPDLSTQSGTIAPHDERVHCRSANTGQYRSCQVQEAVSKDGGLQLYAQQGAWLDGTLQSSPLRASCMPRFGATTHRHKLHASPRMRMRMQCLPILDNLVSSFLYPRAAHRRAFRNKLGHLFSQKR